MSGLFKSKKQEPEYYGTPQDDRINEMYDLVKPWADKYLGSNIGGNPYGGELVAPLTSMEKQNLSSLQKYLDSPLASQSKEFGYATQELERIFGDYYDPWKSGGPIEYTRRQLQKSLTEDFLPSLRQSKAAKGSLYSSGYVQDEQSLAGDIMDELAKYAYGAEENMIARRQSAIPTAMNVATFRSEEPYQRLAQTMGLAGYERTQYDQPLDTANYNEFQRLLNELQTVTGYGMDLSRTSGGGKMAYPQYTPSPFQQYVMPMLQTAMMAGGMALGGPAGAAAGAGLAGAGSMSSGFNRITGGGLYLP